MDDLLSLGASHHQGGGSIKERSRLLVERGPASKQVRRVAHGAGPITDHTSMTHDQG